MFILFIVALALFWHFPSYLLFDVVKTPEEKVKMLADWEFEFFMDIIQFKDIIKFQDKTSLMYLTPFTAEELSEFITDDQFYLLQNVMEKPTQKYSADEVLEIITLADKFSATGDSKNIDCIGSNKMQLPVDLLICPFG